MLLWELAEHCIARAERQETRKAMLRAWIGRSAGLAAARLCPLQSAQALISRIPSHQQSRQYRMSPFLPPPSDSRPIRGERRATITLEMIGRTFLVHSGKEFKRIKVAASMVGHKMGEFVMTRKIVRRQRGKQQRK